MTKRIVQGLGTTDKPVSTSYGFKVYNKIDVYMRQTGSALGWTYLHSTCTYKTCLEASYNAAQGKGEHSEFTSWFS